MINISNNQVVRRKQLKKNQHVPGFSGKQQERETVEGYVRDDLASIVSTCFPLFHTMLVSKHQMLEKNYSSIFALFVPLCRSMISSKLPNFCKSALLSEKREREKGKIRRNTFRRGSSNFQKMCFEVFAAQPAKRWCAWWGKTCFSQRKGGNNFKQYFLCVFCFETPSVL